MKYNSEKHNRHSIRLKGYDYSNPGAYFLAICAQNRARLFGEIVDGKMILNDAGQMVEKWHLEIKNKYPDIKCDEHITMPNHFHCIIETPDIPSIPVRMALCGHPALNQDAHAGASLRGNQRPGRISIFDIMDWFKTMTTNEYIRGVKNNNWQRFEKRIWQLRYWDHIIRNDLELSRIRRYIQNNSQNWQKDTLGNGNGNLIMEKPVEYEIESWMV